MKTNSRVGHDVASSFNERRLSTWRLQMWISQVLRCAPFLLMGGTLHSQTTGNSRAVEELTWSKSGIMRRVELGSESLSKVELLRRLNLPRIELGSCNRSTLLGPATGFNFHGSLTIRSSLCISPHHPDVGA